MFQVRIDTDYKVGIYDKNLARTFWRDDDEYVRADDPAPAIISIPRIIEMLDSLYLEVRRGLLDELNESEQHRVPIVGFTRDGSERGLE